MEEIASGQKKDYLLISSEENTLVKKQTTEKAKKKSLSKGWKSQAKFYQEDDYSIERNYKYGFQRKEEESQSIEA